MAACHRVDLERGEIGVTRPEVEPELDLAHRWAIVGAGRLEPIRARAQPWLSDVGSGDAFTIERMNLTHFGWAQSGHSSGTVEPLEDILERQKCPSRERARGESIEHPTPMSSNIQRGREFSLRPDESSLAMGIPSLFVNPPPQSPMWA